MSGPAAQDFRSRASPARLPPLAALVVAGVLGTLAGCAGRSEGALAPTPLRAAGTTSVEMLIATTRAPTGRPGAPFSGERGNKISLDRMVVSIPPEALRHVGEIQWPESRPADPATSFAVLDSRPLDVPGAVGWFHHTGRRRVLVFVHGFDTRHDEAVFLLAQLIPVWNYDYDKDSTNWSRDALEDVLRRVATDPDVSDVTVLAHSMGSWLAVEALRQIAIRDGRVPAKIANVILASPDLDVDVFGRQLARIGKGPHFTVFVSGDDRALDLSKFIAGGVERLGGIDPFAEPHRSMLEKQGVTVLDLTALKGGDATNHGKFAKSPAVVRLLGERLIAGQPVADQHIGLGDQVGALMVGGLGTAGSLASRVPIYVLDGGRR